MSIETIELVGLGQRLARQPLTPEQRETFERGERLRAARKAAELALIGRLSAGGPCGPAADAALLMESRFPPVGSIMSLDYPAPPPDMADILRS